MPDKRAALRTLRGVDLKLPQGGDLAAVVINEPTPLISVGLFYTEDRPEVIVGEMPISSYIWQGSAGRRGLPWFPLLAATAGR